ncbi:MAG: sulfite exporter TauE/SafE family protein [Pirellulaceae bacterium]
MFSFSIATIVFAILVALVGGVIQATIGFGMGVVTIPVLVWIGIPLHHAIGMMLPCIVFQTALNSWQHKAKLPWRDILRLFALRLIGLPMGIAILHQLSQTGTNATRQVLGIGLIAIIGLRWFEPNLPSKRMAGVSTYLFGLLSGLAAGLIGMGGPPLVLWVMQQPWDSVRQRTFLWTSFLLVTPIQGAILMYSFGAGEMADAYAAGMLLVPAVVSGSWLGNHLAKRLSAERLRLLMTSFLLIIAIRFVVSPFWAETVPGEKNSTEFHETHSTRNQK